MKSSVSSWSVQFARLLVAAGLVALGGQWLRAASVAVPAQRIAIVTPARPSSLEVLAAREVQRYVYVRTGELLSIRAATETASGAAGQTIVVGQKDQEIVARAVIGPAGKATLASLGPETYWLKTLPGADSKVLLVTGGDAVGTLYAAYALAEQFGVRFYLHGDELPAVQVPCSLPTLDEIKRPLFKLRGIQPFHDFPEGPDWWNTDEYLAIISQLPKLRMNFFGLHTYPEGAPNAEPTVWIGPPSEIGDGGKVKASYPASYQNTLRGNWGYTSKKTSAFSFGASQLFDRDDFGPEVMRDACPQPATAQTCNEVFDRTAAMLRIAFQQAHELGVKTCVGTETPLTVPKAVQDRLRAQGKDPRDHAVLEELYQGIFTRAAQAYHLDYYWFWTPEGWTWETTKDSQVKTTIDDLLTAIGAAKKVSAPFQLATCGWVLGPQQDRALFDKVLPKEVSVSCINREVGRTPVDKGFADVQGRGKWAIPWMEDDPALSSPQLWVGRMRRDAADALRYGCDGLMGIHWRTRALGPNVSALAQAAWEQSSWSSPATEPAALPKTAGPVGGQTVTFTQPIADTDDDPLYQSVRYNLSAYHLQVADGPCAVTLKFCEPHYREAGKRVFDVKLQGRQVLTNLDIFAKVGPNRALDFSFGNVAITNGWLDIEFVPKTEFPLIAAISIEGIGSFQRINCGGGAYKDYVADLPGVPAPGQVYPATADFYQDWARHQFGPEIGAAAAVIFSKIDGRLPRPSDWVDGPGGLRPDPRPWSKVELEYSFVDEFQALADKVPASHRPRFDYWADTLAYMRTMAHVNCLWAEYQQAIQRVKAEPDPAAQKQRAHELALPLRRALVQTTSEVYAHLLALVSTPGELGTVANWDQHILPDLLEKPGLELAKLLGEPLPADALPAKVYRGPTRVIVPTLRSSIRSAEGLQVPVIILSEAAPREALLQWRPFGRGAFRSLPLEHQARGVYSLHLPAEAVQGTGFEYCIKVTPQAGPAVYYPPSAPLVNQSVVVAPQSASL